MNIGWASFLAFCALGRWPRIHRLFHREPFDRPCRICRFVWSRMLADASFREGLARGQADFAAGRTTRYEVIDGELIPVPEAR